MSNFNFHHVSKEGNRAESDAQKLKLHLNFAKSLKRDNKYLCCIEFIDSRRIIKLNFNFLIFSKAQI